MRACCALTVLLSLALAGCESPTIETASEATRRELALERWNACSHFSSVELVEATEEGRLHVREKGLSSPPPDFLRCISAVEFSQVRRGVWPASEIVIAGYFTTEYPAGVVYRGGLGKMPETAKRFAVQQPLWFMYFVEYTGTTFKTTVDWYDPTGGKVWSVSQNQDHRGDMGKHASYYDRASLPLGNIRVAGTWLVKLQVDGNHAGTFSFVLESS